MKRIVKKLTHGLSHTRLRSLLVGWRHLGLNDGDAFIASYPKSGNTWLKHMLVQLLTGAEHEFYREGRDPLIPQVGRQTATPLRTPLGGRVLKTHEPYRSCYRNVLYVARDGRDVAISNYWFHCRKRKQQLGFEVFMRQFLDGRINAYGSWADNVRSWIDSPLWDSPHLLLVRYEDLHRRPVEVMSEVCDFFSVDASQETLQSVIAGNSFDSMQRREKRNARMTNIEKSTGIPFVRKGVVGQWQEVFSEAQLREFDERHSDIYEALGYSNAFGDVTPTAL